MGSIIDVFNFGEYNMRIYWKNKVMANPLATIQPAELSNYWISQLQAGMTSATGGLGRVARIKSMNATTPCVPLAYKYCYQ
jgi:hypothetical protein